MGLLLSAQIFRSKRRICLDRITAMYTPSEVALIVPTLNAAADWPKFIAAFRSCAIPKQVLIVDSSSTDNTVNLAKAAGFRVESLARSDFNHGTTRRWAADLASDARFLVYLTQDAILASPDSLRNLLAAFDNPAVGAAYGRQLPHTGAGPIESHARLFNYPVKSHVRSLQSRERLGIKAIFLSNSFAAYRRTALEAVGGFPTDVIFGEDMITAARLLLSGWEVAYVADAPVYHSHAYSLSQDFRRYFDIGVLHSREPWLLEQFGKATGEGKRFVLSELNYLWPRHAALVPSAFIRTVAKFIGYRMGRIEKKLSTNLKRSLSMHQNFWPSRVD